MNVNTESVISMVQNADIFLVVSKRPDFDRSYTKMEVFEPRAEHKIKSIEVGVHRLRGWFFHAKMELNFSVARHILLFIQTRYCCLQYDGNETGLKWKKHFSLRKI